ncbi:MAG: hypothetical protein AAFP78_02540 [Pseudomonadota bacterium]
MKRLAPSVLIFYLAACAQSGGLASLTSAQCDADWRAVGAADARDGAAASKIEAYKAGCARGGATLSDADVKAWRDGYAALNEAAIASRTASTAVTPSAREDPATLPPTEEGEPSAQRDDGWRGPRIYPTFGIGVGIGSGGTRIGSRVGVGIGFPIY